MMITQLTVTVQDRVQNRARQLSKQTGHSVEEILEAMLELSLSPFIPQVDFDQSLSTLPDSEIMSLTDLQMQPERNERLSILLDQQQNAAMNEKERIELQTLMRVYEIGMVYKSQALAEAVKRGLRQPLKP
jgi:hypothetical protein